jgi:hypothetical protein
MVVVAEDPAGAVEVDDQRQRSAGALRAQDAHRHLAGRAAGHGGVPDVDGWLVDRAGLDRIDGPATLVGAELKHVGRVGVGDGLRRRVEVDGVGYDRLSSGPPGSSSCRRATVTGSSADGTADLRAATDQHQHVPGARHRRQGSDAARQRGCTSRERCGGMAWMRPDLAGPGRLLLRPQAVPASRDPRRTRCVSTFGSGKAVVRDPWPVLPHQKWVNQTRPAAGSAAGAVGVALPRRPVTRSVVAQPAGVHPTTRAPPGPSVAAVGSCGAQRARPP